MLRVRHLVKIKKYLLYVFGVVIKEKEDLPTCVYSCYLTQLQDLIPLTEGDPESLVLYVTCALATDNRIIT